PPSGVNRWDSASLMGNEVSEAADIRPDIGVYVPRPNTIAWVTIPLGSAMVIDPPAGATQDTVVICYFETWERHDRQLTPFATLVSIAGGRCHWHKIGSDQWKSYPTQSKAPLRLGDLVHVGEFDDYRGEVRIEQAHESLLCEWLAGCSDLAWHLRAQGRR